MKILTAKQQAGLAAVCVFASVLAVLLIYWPTFRDMLGTGPGNDEYTHRVFVMPIFAFVIWSLRFELAKLPVRGCWLALTGLLAAGILWLAGSLTFIRIFTDVAVVVMMPMAMLVIFGFRWIWTAIFPLFLLLFLLSVGGPLVDLQVDLTSRVVYSGLLASGIPVLREGAYFELPTGRWTVAAACSGIEYLSATLMMTSLYAWTLYQSARKRVLFMLGAFVLGLAGNWLRAYLTILIAHLSDNRYLRTDHMTFGWYLFAGLLFLYCALGWYYRDPDRVKQSSGLSGERVATNAAGISAILRAPFYARVFAVLALLLIWPILGNVVLKPHHGGVAEIATLVPKGGWHATASPATIWMPSLTRPSRQRQQSFEKDGVRVDVFIGIFAEQNWTSKLVTSVNDFVSAESTQWRYQNKEIQSVGEGDASFDVKSALLFNGVARVAAWQWYWIDGKFIGKDLKAKMAQLRSRLTAQDDIGAWVAISTSHDSTGKIAPQVLSNFLKDMREPLTEALGRTTQNPEPPKAVGR